MFITQTLFDALKLTHNSNMNMYLVPVSHVHSSDTVRYIGTTFLL